MRRTIVLWLMLLFTSEMGLAQSPPETWSRKIPTNNITWKLQTNGYSLHYTDDTPISNNLVRSYIIAALTAWKNAINQYGTVVTISENQTSGQMVFEYSSLSPGECGRAEDWERIELNRDFGYASGTALATGIYHEIGHAFLGSGHGGDGVMSNTVGDYCDVQHDYLSAWESGVVHGFYDPLYTVVVRNDFSGAGGGSVKVDNQTVAGGSSYQWRPSGGSHSFEAIDHQVQPYRQGQYTFEYRQWYNDQYDTKAERPTLSFSSATTKGETYTANFVAMYNLTFNTVPSGLELKVENTTRTDGFETQVASDENAISAEGMYQVRNLVEYTFDHWSEQPGQDQKFHPTDHTTYTVTYAPKPLPPADISVGGSVGDYVHINWTGHPEQGVQQYQIWRKVKPKNQSEGQPVLLATVSKPTTAFIDYDYVVTDGYTDDLLKYDVRSCLTYGSSTIYSDPNYTSIYGEQELWKIPVAGSIPLEFSLEAFPNPFNPSTRILYSLKQGGKVKLTISDITGRDVLTLIDQQLSASRYSVVWKGANQAGKQVGSGVYFARIVVTDELGHVAHKQTVRLLLTK